MKTIDIISVAALVIIFLLIYEGKKGMSGWQKNLESGEPSREQIKEGQKERPTRESDTPPKTDLKSFESYFDEGLPSEFVPKHPESFPDVEKLRQDLEYRRQKLDYAITEERRELGNLTGTEADKRTAYDAMVEKHRKARMQLDQVHSKIMGEYQKQIKDEKARNKELR